MEKNVDDPKWWHKTFFKENGQVNARLCHDKQFEKMGLIPFLDSYEPWIVDETLQKKNKNKVFLLAGLKHVGKCKHPDCEKKIIIENKIHCSMQCKNTNPESRAIVSQRSAEKSPERKLEIQEKKKATNLERYGVEHALQIPGKGESVRKQRLETLVDRFGEDWGKVIYKKGEDSHGGVHPFQENGWKSKAEYECIEVLKSYGIPESEIIHGDRKSIYPLEIDIRIPKCGIGIEQCGTYFHSERYKSNTAHRDKLLAAAEKHIRVIFIWSHEWAERRNQVMNFILPALKIHNRKIDGRKTIFSKLDKRMAKVFIDANHIQPINLSNIQNAFGLFYEDELVSCMTFGYHHRNGTQEVVLNRYCCSSGVHIPGGASKLFVHAIEAMDISEVSTWSHDRLSNGNMYKQLGFQVSSRLAPDYFYIDSTHCKVIPKQSATKTILGARAGQTERQRADELGLLRVYDCGKTKWVWKTECSKEKTPVSQGLDLTQFLEVAA